MSLDPRLVTHDDSSSAASNPPPPSLRKYDPDSEPWKSIRAHHNAALAAAYEKGRDAKDREITAHVSGMLERQGKPQHSEPVVAPTKEFMEAQWRQEDSKASRSGLVANYIRWFAREIEHGDKRHRHWLRDAAESFIKDRTIPPRPCPCEPQRSEQRVEYHEDTEGRKYAYLPPSEPQQQDWTPEMIEATLKDRPYAASTIVSKHKAALAAERGKLTDANVAFEESELLLKAEKEKVENLHKILGQKREMIKSERQRREQAELALDACVQVVEDTNKQLLSTRSQVLELQGCIDVMATEFEAHDKTKQQLLSALAAIEEHNDLIDKGHQSVPIRVDLSLLRKHDAEVRKPLVDALMVYHDAMDKLYNHNEATRTAVVTHFGTTHPRAALDALAKVKEKK